MPCTCIICEKIVTFRSTPIQIHTNMSKNYFPPNIVQTKYNKFTVFHCWICLAMWSVACHSLCVSIMSSTLVGYMFVSLLTFSYITSLISKFWVKEDYHVPESVIYISFQVLCRLQRLGSAITQQPIPPPRTLSSVSRHASFIFIPPGNNVFLEILVFSRGNRALQCKIICQWFFFAFLNTLRCPSQHISFSSLLSYLAKEIF